jgi:hypothetical protein
VQLRPVSGVILHPLAVILMWVNLAGRTDLDGTKKVVWAIFAIFAIIPIVPILYAIVGDGALW